MDRGNRSPLQLIQQQENNKMEGIFTLRGPTIPYMGRDKVPPRLLLKNNKREQGICFKGSCQELFCRGTSTFNYPHIKDVKEVKEGLG